jgi:hypothetical protein
VEKVSLPTKTKIVAWGITVIGGLGLIASMLVLLMIMFEENEINIRALYLVLMFLVPPSVGFFFPGIMTLFKKRLGWWFSVLILTLFILIILFSQMYDFIHTMDDCKAGAYDKDYLLDYKAEVCSIKSYLIHKWFFLIPCLIFFTPLIFLLLDRKNFWKIAT